MLTRKGCVPVRMNIRSAFPAGPSLWGALCVALALVLAGPKAHAAVEERHALVIGNGNYSQLGRLANPTSDAELIAERLRSVGFKVEVRTDLDGREFKKAIAQFGRTLRAASNDAVGLFYYAGHAVQSNGVNYLLPLGEFIQDEADLPVFAIQADWVLAQMESARISTRIVILDACRDNPFEGDLRSMRRGLSQMSAPTGSYIAYSTAPGKVAFDGTARNSPFAIALADRLQDEGAGIESLFKRVRVDVIRATGGRQTPWDSSSLTREFVFRPGLPATAATAGRVDAAPVRADSAAADKELKLWRHARQTKDPEVLRAYLLTFPDGIYVEHARELLSISGDRPETYARVTPQRAAKPEAAPARAPTPTPTSTPTRGVNGAWSGRDTNFEINLTVQNGEIAAELNSTRVFFSGVTLSGVGKMQPDGNFDFVVSNASEGWADRRVWGNLKKVSVSDSGNAGGAEISLKKVR